MRFDDRLLTVLNQPAADRHDAAVRWRQLVDLVARAGSNAASPMVGQALDAIRAEAAEVDENLRAAAARAVAALPLPLGLMEYFAADRLTVSAPILAAATLEPAQWRSILAAADEETRRFVETLHPELKSEIKPELKDEAPTDLTDSLVEAPTDARAGEPQAGTSLHDVVARIERRRRARSAAPRAAEQPGSVPMGSPALFRWECGPAGEIAWVDGAPRGALIGRSIARPQESDGDRVDPEVVRAFTLRAPFRDASLVVAGDGLVSGEWKISGIPAFEPVDGRFAGYRGVALREMPAAAQSEPAADLLPDPDSLRELVHEIKTPLNAIIGFAEIIEGQLLGPADRRYRERAHEIVGQARLLLTAIDDLDFAAKLHSADAKATARVHLRELVERITPTVRELAQERQVVVEIVRNSGECTAAVQPELADRLIFRMCTAMIHEAESGERLRIAIDHSARHCRVSITRPARLAGLSSEQLFGAGEQQFQEGFSLRLVRGLARVAGADLTATRNALALVFPQS